MKKSNRDLKIEGLEGANQALRAQLETAEMNQKGLINTNKLYKHEIIHLNQTIRSLHWSLNQACTYLRDFQRSDKYHDRLLEINKFFLNEVKLAE